MKCDQRFCKQQYWSIIILNFLWKMKEGNKCLIYKNFSAAVQSTLWIEESACFIILTFDKNTHRFRTEASFRDEVFLHQHLHAKLLLRRRYNRLIWKETYQIDERLSEQVLSNIRNTLHKWIAMISRNLHFSKLQSTYSDTLSKQLRW